MPLKDKIENNLTLFVLGLLVTGFSAGLGAYKVLVEIAGAGSTGSSANPPVPMPGDLPA